MMKTISQEKTISFHHVYTMYSILR